MAAAWCSCKLLPPSQGWPSTATSWRSTWPTYPSRGWTASPSLFCRRKSSSTSRGHLSPSPLAQMPPFSRFPYSLAYGGYFAHLPGTHLQRDGPFCFNQETRKLFCLWFSPPTVHARIHNAMLVFNNILSILFLSLLTCLNMLWVKKFGFKQKVWHTFVPANTFPWTSLLEC